MMDTEITIVCALSMPTLLICNWKQAGLQNCDYLLV